MLYASDLDRTLIYSSKLIHENIFDESNIKIVENLDGKPISYMTHEAIKMLRDIESKLLFVPVTTRTKEQYDRISIFKELDLKYAVVANGGVILENGIENLEWKKDIKKKIKANCIHMDDAIKEFENIKNEWVLKLKAVEDLFFYCIIDEQNVPEEKLKLYVSWMKDRNWVTSRQGRKLYFIPKYVSKGAAVEYIASKEGIEKIVSSGDSLLDLTMSDVSDKFIVPKHGGICEAVDGETECMSYTTIEGIQAAEEILKSTFEFFDI